MILSIVLFFVLFLVLIFIGVPIGVSLGSTALILIIKYQMGIQVFSANFYAGIAKFPLLAIPFFILAGVIFEKADIAKRIVDFSRLIVGNMTGGLAIVTIIVAIFWGAVSGSGPATTAVLGLILIPAMVADGYDKGFASAVTASSSGLAIIIPPSIAFIVYGLITQDSVSALFAAGVVPGLIIGLCLIMAAYLVSKKKGYKVENVEKLTLKSFLSVLKDAFWGLLAPVIILGSIYGGIATPTEAAVIAVFYGLFVGFFIYKTLTLKILYKALVTSVVSSAVVMIVVSFAGLYSWVGNVLGIMDVVANGIINFSDNPIVVILLINVTILIAGMFLDAISIYYVFLPIFIPIIHHFGWNSIWFGVVLTINLAIGQVTPPVAVNMYVASNVAGVPIEDISKWAFLFVLASVVGLAIIILFPELTLWLPRLLNLI